MRRVALIPSYEPDETLIDIVQKLFQDDFEIVVVDDGSGMKYHGIFDTVDLYGDVIHYDENRGKGFALKTGFKYIEERMGECVIVTMDSDGQHLPKDAAKLCQRVETHPYEFVIGSRKLPKDAPKKSKLGNGITRNVYRHLTGVNVYDTQSGLRAFSNGWLKRLQNIEGDRYEYEMNVLLYIAKHGLPVKEIPIETIYFDKTNSVSHFKAFSDSARIYGEILKFALSSFSSFLIDYGMYALLTALLGTGQTGLIIANLGARTVSSVFNFTVNKRLVFKSKGNLAKETAKYFGLVLFNIGVNTLILTGLTKLGMNAYLAKILVEAVMFLFSYVMQHFVVFRKKKDSDDAGKKSGSHSENNKETKENNYGKIYVKSMGRENGINFKEVSGHA